MTPNDAIGYAIAILIVALAIPTFIMGMKIALDLWTEPRKFEYSLRMRDGRYLRKCIGTSIEDAARRAGEDLAQVKRALPVRKVLTQAERDTRAQRFEQLRKKAKGEADAETD